MRLSTKGRYAVTAVIDLASHSRGAPIALADIAERQEISLSYLEQLFARLRRAGVVRSVRGPGGGYLLAHPPEAIRVDDIITAVDEPIVTTRCTGNHLGGCRQNQARCLTHDLWQGLGNQIQRYLHSLTVADVVAGRLDGPMGEKPVEAGPAEAGAAA